MNQKLLRELPKIDGLALKVHQSMNLPESVYPIVVSVVRNLVNGLRQDILDGKMSELPSEEELAATAVAMYEKKVQRKLRPVVNATGVVLHTNLGRSILSRRAAEAARDASSRYNTLEYNLEEGTRGSRHDLVSEWLKELCGCEASMVVNNNAAAVLLILSTLANGKNVITSRGELVEIGGSFRVPEIMEMSGTTLKEVGTTNKTRGTDYSRAIDEETAALLKVHTSNFRITGFTESVDLTELAAIAHEHGLPAIYDMGSGSILPLDFIKGADEPNVLQSLQAGVDLVCFSGDKLLGGPQAGIIVGKEEYISRMKKNPLTRALRVDKMTLAALEETLRQYLEGEPFQTIPTLHMLTASVEELQQRYEKLEGMLKGLGGLTCERMESQAPAGGGSLPGVMLPTICMAVSVEGMTSDRLEKKLRGLPNPIVARINNDRVLLDFRTIQEEELSLIYESMKWFMETEGLS